MLRAHKSDEGTGGFLFSPSTNFQCVTLEPPWRDNMVGISCIPPGTYIVKTRISPKYGKVYMVNDVQGRSYILFHAGNYAGDKSKGYKAHSTGCILLGQKHGKLGGQFAILNSRVTVRRFIKLMKYETFKLVII